MSVQGDTHTIYTVTQQQLQKQNIHDTKQNNIHNTITKLNNHVILNSVSVLIWNI